MGAPPANNALQLTRSHWHVPHVEPLRGTTCNGSVGPSQVNAVLGRYSRELRKGEVWRAKKEPRPTRRAVSVDGDSAEDRK
jgi:hypothetical protein